MASKLDKGYILVFSNNLLTLWGHKEPSSSSDNTINFSISFNTKCYGILFSSIANNTGRYDAHVLEDKTISKTGCTIFINWNNLDTIWYVAYGV